MNEHKFNYAGKLSNEIFLLLLGVSLTLFLLYELMISDDMLILRSVELTPMMANILLGVLLLSSIGLTVVSIANVRNRKNKKIIIKDNCILIPKQFSKNFTQIYFSSIEQLERQEVEGIEFMMIKIKNKISRVSLESSKFDSTMEYANFIKCLNSKLN